MTLIPRLTAFTLVALIAATPMSTLADEGHDHGDAPTTSNGPALPRFAAVGDTFELVGVLNGHDLTLWLDRTDDNSPVIDARLELMVGGVKVEVEQHAPGEFEAELAEEPEEGELAISALVAAGQQREQLSAELDIHHDEHAEASTSSTSRARYLVWGVGGLLVLVLLGWAVRRSRSTHRLRKGAL